MSESNGTPEDLDFPKSLEEAVESDPILAWLTTQTNNASQNMMEAIAALMVARRLEISAELRREFHAKLGMKE